MKGGGFARPPARPAEELAQLALMGAAWLLLVLVGQAFVW